jgi:hypothetical protein
MLYQKLNNIEIAYELTTKWPTSLQLQATAQNASSNTNQVSSCITLHKAYDCELSSNGMSLFQILHIVTEWRTVECAFPWHLSGPP